MGAEVGSSLHVYISVYRESKIIRRATAPNPTDAYAEVRSWVFNDILYLLLTYFESIFSIGFRDTAMATKRSRNDIDLRTKYEILKPLKKDGSRESWLHSMM